MDETLPLAEPPLPLTPPPASGPARIPSPALVLLGVLSVQIGSAVARHLFAQAGPGGAAFLRLFCGAVVLALVMRPTLRGYSSGQYRVAMLFGLTVAAMNLSFYAALARIPLGVAVTLEFVGPLGLAAVGARRWPERGWVLLAAAGVMLLAPWGGFHPNPAGVLFALLAGMFWALYILLSARMGQAFSGAVGLLIALITGSVALAPVGVAVAGRHLLRPLVLVEGLGVGVLSSVIPYSAEMEALRRLPTRTFGVLMSTEPAIAALVGFVFLQQTLSARALVAIVLVTCASTGASLVGHEG